MERKGEIEEIDINNCTCYCFDYIMGVWDKYIDNNFNGIFLNKTLYKEKNEIILVHDISYHGCKTIAYKVQ